MRLVGTCPVKQVGRPRAARDEADARLARGARVPVRRMHQPLLVAGQYDVERRLPVQRVENIDRHASGICEKGVHALFFERFYKQLRSFDLHDKPPVPSAPVRGQFKKKPP